jgi:hypothetical protein
MWDNSWGLESYRMMVPEGNGGDGIVESDGKET